MSEDSCNQMRIYEFMYKLSQHLLSRGRQRRRRVTEAAWRCMQAPSWLFLWTILYSLISPHNQIWLLEHTMTHFVNVRSALWCHDCICFVACLSSTTNHSFQEQFWIKQYWSENALSRILPQTSWDSVQDESQHFCCFSSSCGQWVLQCSSLCCCVHGPILRTSSVTARDAVCISLALRPAPQHISPPPATTEGLAPVSLRHEGNIEGCQSEPEGTFFVVFFYGWVALITLISHENYKLINDEWVQCFPQSSVTTH